MLETPIGTMKGRMRLGLEKMRHALGGGAGEPRMSTPDPSTSAGPTPSPPTCSARCPTTSARGFEAHLAELRARAATRSSELRVAADALPMSVPPRRAAAGAQGAHHGRRRRRGRAAGRRRRAAPTRRRREPRRARAPRLARLAARGRASRSPARSCCSSAAALGGVLLARRRRTRAPCVAARRRRAPRSSSSRRRRRDARRARDAARRPGPHLPGLAQAPGPGPGADDALFAAQRTARPTSRCPARSTGSSRCWSPTSRRAAPAPTRTPVIAAAARLSRAQDRLLGSRAAMATCYRHPRRETGVSCSNCGRPICPDCMTATPVGMRCPECSGQKQRSARCARCTRADRHLRADRDQRAAVPRLGRRRVVADRRRQRRLAGLQRLRAVRPGDRVGHEYWRLVTAGFLHAGLLHIGFNMYILYWLGTMLEPALGRVRFVALYFASLLAGSLGALLLSPNAVTVGASGAVFGLMGAAFVIQRARGIDPMQSGIGPLILLNLGLTFVIPGISIGGHIGGLVGGVLACLRDGAARPRRCAGSCCRSSPACGGPDRRRRGDRRLRARLALHGLGFPPCPTTSSPSSRSPRGARTSTSGTRSWGRSSSTGCCSPRSATRPTTASSATRSRPTATRSTR